MRRCRPTSPRESSRTSARSAGSRRRASSRGRMQSAPDETAIAEAVTAGTDGIVVPPALLEDPPAGKGVEPTLLVQLQTMTVSEKIKLSLRGNRDARMLLIRDANKMIRRFVLQNPR